jgi:hypothetical protein
MDLPEQAKKRNIIDMAVGFTGLMRLFQEGSADLQGIDVFEFLAELALEKAQAQRGRNRGTNANRPKMI